MRTLAITQNITVDGSIEMLGDWFDPQGQGDTDNSDLLEELHRQDRDADGLLVGRRTFQDLRGYWPQQSDDTTGITAYLNQVQKYVVSSTMAQPDWQNSKIVTSDVANTVGALKEEPGQDIVVTGSITLCHALIEAGLVDQYRLFVYPVVQVRRDRAVGARHCWVSGLPGDPGRWPGLLAEWAQRDGGWFGRVVYAVDDGDPVVLVAAWVAAEHLEPAAR